MDLAHEKQSGEFVRALIADGMATAVHDCSDGGLALALAEMAMTSGIGAKVNQLNDHDPIMTFFGEDQGRYVVTINKDQLDAFHGRATKARIFAPWIGNTGGTVLILGDADPIGVAALKAAHENWFPDFMGEKKLANAA